MSIREPKANLNRRKRCRKGKSCGSSCIHHKKLCLIDLSIETQSQVKSLKRSLRQSDPPDSRGIKSRRNIERILNSLHSQSNVKVTDGVVKDKDVKWTSALERGVNFVGGGESGQFATVPANRLVKGGGTRFPGGVGIKSGEIGPNEVEAIRKAGELGVGPQLIAARVSSRLKAGSNYPEGVIAMSKVPGKRLIDLPEGSISGGTSGKAVMLAASALHRVGISHNDMHSGNIYVDANGKVRFVDFGMARLSPKHALAEAMRQFGDLGNLRTVEERLVSLGVTPREFRRMKVSFGNYVEGGGWDKISDEQALSLISTFYRESP